jgi:hypothetical protein
MSFPANNSLKWGSAITRWKNNFEDFRSGAFPTIQINPAVLRIVFVYIHPAKICFMKPFYSLILLFLSLSSFAQTNNARPCSAPQASQFDFWVGDWKLTWNDSLHGTNHVERMFGNCTIHENFLNPKTNYSGQSWSVYSPATGQWNQTWVDNQGGYIALTGSFEGDSMILKTAERQTAKGKQQMRMIYYNIKPGSFDWSWEASADGGISWKPSWQIHYQRVTDDR